MSAGLSLGQPCAWQQDCPQDSLIAAALASCHLQSMWQCSYIVQWVVLLAVRPSEQGGGTQHCVQQWVLQPHRPTAAKSWMPGHDCTVYNLL